MQVEGSHQNKQLLGGQYINFSKVLLLASRVLQDFVHQK